MKLHSKRRCWSAFSMLGFLFANGLAIEATAAEEPSRRQDGTTFELSDEVIASANGDIRTLLRLWIPRQSSSSDASFEYKSASIEEVKAGLFRFCESSKGLLTQSLLAERMPPSASLICTDGSGAAIFHVKIVAYVGNTTMAMLNGQTGPTRFYVSNETNISTTAPGNTPAQWGYLQGNNNPDGDEAIGFAAGNQFADSNTMGKFSVMIGSIPIEARNRGIPFESTNMYLRAQEWGMPPALWKQTQIFLRDAAPHIKPEHTGVYFSLYAVDGVPMSLVTAASKRVGFKCNQLSDDGPAAKICHAAEVREIWLETRKILEPR